jgi:hypothetical protein
VSKIKQTQTKQSKIAINSWQAYLASYETSSCGKLPLYGLYIVSEHPDTQNKYSGINKSLNTDAQRRTWSCDWLTHFRITHLQARGCSTSIQVHVKNCAFHRGWTNLGWSQVVRDTKFCIGAPNIRGSSAWNLFHVILPVSRILRWLLDFWKICGPLHFLFINLAEPIYSSHLI